MRTPARRFLRAWPWAIWACLLAALVPPAARAADRPTVPMFWQPAEAAPKPDLAALPRLRFLTAGDFPPLNGTDAQGRPVGFNVDLAREICAELALGDRCGVELRPFAELEKALLAGEGDAVIAGIAIDARSRGALAFSRPYLAFPGRFVMRAGDALEEPLWRGLAGRKVGAVAGTAHERFLRVAFPAAFVTPYPDAAAMLAALAAGEVRAAFGDGMRLSFWLAGDAGAACCRFAGGPYLAPDQFGPGMATAVRPQDRALLGALDHALQALAERRKTAELYYRWFPVGFF